MKNSVLPRASQTFTNGEVEDYTINIGSAVARTSDAEITISKNEEYNKLNFSIYPNPVEDSIL